MTEPAPGLDEPYPDVSVGKRAAIIVTTASAVIYAAAFICFAVDTEGAGLVLLASLILAATLLILSYVDLRTGLLLDVLTLPLILMGIGWAAFAPVGTGAGPDEFGPWRDHRIWPDRRVGLCLATLSRL